MEEEPASEERTQRARAAWGYSLMTHEELAKAAGMKLTSVRNALDQTKAGPKMPALYKIVKAAGLDRSFAEQGPPLIAREGEAPQDERTLGARNLLGAALTLAEEQLRERP